MGKKDTCAWEFYSEWMREVEKINFPELLNDKPTAAQEKKEETKPSGEVKKEEKTEEKKEEKSGLPAVPVSVTTALKAMEKQQEAQKPNPETDYCCRLEGKDLKFL